MIIMVSACTVDGGPQKIDRRSGDIPTRIKKEREGGLRFKTLLSFIKCVI